MRLDATVRPRSSDRERAVGSRSHWRHSGLPTAGAVSVDLDGRLAMSRRRHRRRDPGGHGSGTAHAAPPQRFAAIDGLRGFAICLMLVYHFAFDLAWFRVFRADFNNDVFWLGFRAVIVTLFMALVGVSLVLARGARQGRRAFWRRIALIAACAALVSVASYVTFPQTFITFGILHCIAVSSVLARPLVDFPRAALLAGIAIIVLGNTVHLPLFDAPWLNWIGMTTHKPGTEDYVPLFLARSSGVIAVAIRCFRASDARVSEALVPLWLTWRTPSLLISWGINQCWWDPTRAVVARDSAQQNPGSNTTINASGHRWAQPGLRNSSTLLIIDLSGA